MSANPKSRPSFSPASRWQIGLDVVLRTALVLAVVVMVNYLGAKFYHRFYLSSQTQVELSSRTLTVLHSLTNHVEVTLYYDRKDGFLPGHHGVAGRIPRRRTRKFPSAPWIMSATPARRKR